jgi:hypothetical protein
MNNATLLKQLTNISFSSQEQMKKLDMFITRNTPTVESMAIITVLLQTNQNVDKMSQLLKKALANMGELHIED